MKIQSHYPTSIRIMGSLMIVGICGWLVVSYTSNFQPSVVPKKAATENFNTEEISALESPQDLVAPLEDKLHVNLESIREQHIQLRKLLEQAQIQRQEDAVILPGSEVRPLRAPRFSSDKSPNTGAGTLPPLQK